MVADRRRKCKSNIYFWIMSVGDHFQSGVFHQFAFISNEIHLYTILSYIRFIFNPKNHLSHSEFKRFKNTFNATAEYYSLLCIYFIYTAIWAILLFYQVDKSEHKQTPTTKITNEMKNIVKCSINECIYSSIHFVNVCNHKNSRKYKFPSKEIKYRWVHLIDSHITYYNGGCGKRKMLGISNESDIYYIAYIDGWNHNFIFYFILNSTFYKISDSLIYAFRSNYFHWFIAR